MVQKVLGEVANIPVTQIVINFVFYFIGGYLLYGALFAAVGSAVDTPADAQQFMLPIMLPIVSGFAGMSMFVFDDPNGSISFWLSIIPYRDDGPHWVWGAYLGVTFIHGHARRWLYFYHMAGRADLPGGNTHAWYKSKLQGTRQVVPNEELA